jgi:hypothetical protein
MVRELTQPSFQFSPRPLSRFIQSLLFEGLLEMALSISVP